MRISRRGKPILVFILVSNSAVLGFAQTKSERDDLGYFGPVRSVLTEIVAHSGDHGRTKAAKRRLYSIERFDAKGVRLENTEYGDDGRPTWRESPIVRDGRVIGWRQSSDPREPASEFFYKFDGAGNIIEESSYSTRGTIDTQSTYSFDANNRMTQMTSTRTGSNGKTELRVKTYSYDPKGRVKEARTFVKGENGLVPVDDSGYHRRVLMYDAGDHWTLATSYSTDNSLVSITRLSRDLKGNETEDIQYDGAGNLDRGIRYTYRYDRRGNWIIQKTFRMKKDDLGAGYKLEEISYRKIRYFVSPGKFKLKR